MLLSGGWPRLNLEQVQDLQSLVPGQGPVESQSGLLLTKVNKVDLAVRGSNACANRPAGGVLVYGHRPIEALLCNCPR